jgi:hypothetical protein
MALEWNEAERWQQESQRRQAVEQQARAQAQQRAAQAAELPYWRATLAAVGPAIAAQEDEVTRLEAAEQAAYARWVRAYHRQTGGATPRQGTGLLVLLRPLDGMGAQELAAIPARGEEAALKKAEAASQEARLTLRQLEADRRALEHNVTLCAQAAGG